MASRRSRLQIKPNILAGPKVPSAKPAPKASGKTASNEGTNSVISDSGNKVKSPVRLTSPRRNPTVSPLKEAISVKNVNKETLQENEEINTSKNETISDCKDDAEKLPNEEPKTPADNADLPQLPTRARLRKFGKVNIAAVRGVKADPVQAKADNKAEHEVAEETQKTESDESKKDENTQINVTLEKGSSNSPANATVVPRRSRFPKAKPNIADAGRRKPKENAIKEETATKSAEVGGHSKVPDIIVTDTEISENDAQPIVQKPEINQPPESPHALTKIQPRLPATPLPVQKSPLKHHTPTIPVSPEKRARTLSTSETPVVKRQRRIKVDAPTDKPPDRATMKMRDLIRWNPTNNPMKPKIKKSETAAVPSVEKENIGNKGKDVAVEEVEETAPEAEDSSLPVPQVTIGPDGNIVINEKSLIVKGPDVEKSPGQDEVIDETDMLTHYGSFRKRNLSKRWSKKDTKKFYRALAMIGIDFFLICQLFPNRTRLEIKKKFQKEEKVNRALVEKVLKERIRFDPTVFDKQDKGDDSSDDEDENDKQKAKKEGKGKKCSKKSGNDVKSERIPGPKKPVKRKKMPLNYYEDELTDEDLEVPEQNTSKSGDVPWQPPSVSQKDGEVVGILMDMSEGRIKGEGQGQGSVMNDMDVGEDSEKFVAVSVNNVQKRQGFIPLEPKSVTSSNSPVQYRGSRGAMRKTVGSVPTIPGIQSISIMETQQTSQPGVEAGTALRYPSRQAASSSSNGQIILPVPNNSASEPETNTQQNVSLLNTRVQFDRNSSQNNTILIEPGASSSQLQTGTRHVHFGEGNGQNQLNLGTSQTQLQQFSAAPVSDNQGNSEETDQYVLVTVMPEGGGETVIHIYRLHGGAQSQNQVLYADPFASQQMTPVSTNISDSTIVIQNSTDLQQAVPTNETSESLTETLTQSENVLVDTGIHSIHSEQEAVPEEIPNSNMQESAYETVTLEVSEPDIQVDIITDDTEAELKDELMVQLTNDPVTTEIPIQSNFTQLISHESTLGEDGKPKIALISEESKPTVLINNEETGKGKCEGNLEYEVENS